MTSYYALGVYIGLSIRGEMPLPLRFSLRTWSIALGRIHGTHQAGAGFLAGLSAVIPTDGLCTLWAEAQLAKVICGDDSMDIALLKSKTVYEDVSCGLVPVCVLPFPAQSCVSWLPDLCGIGPCSLVLGGARLVQR